MSNVRHDPDNQPGEFVDDPSNEPGNQETPPVEDAPEEQEDG
jgi:hypothetical protein